MCNDILKRGTYTFGDDYKLIKGSYIAPKKRKKRKSKKQLRQYLIAGAAALLLVLGVTAYFVKDARTAQTMQGNTATGTGAQVLSLPEFEDEVLLCSGIAKQVFDHQADIQDAVTYGDPYKPFVFKYQLADASGVLRLSEDSALTTYREYVLDKDQTAIRIDNLKTGTTYYYKVIVDGQEYPGSFRTARSNRFISIPGIVNVRDIGGYETLDGKTVKQGLLIRGVEMDGLVNAAYFVPAEAIQEVQDTFGFVHDMDLRQAAIYSGQYQSCLGAAVGHKFYGAPQYGQIFDATYHASLREIFADLADPDKYPMYLHCTWGTDRTGTIVFLLQGILNLSEEDIIQEYKLTGYIAPGIADNSNMDVLIRGLEPYEGDTLQEKIVTYLTTVIGVSENQIQTIRDIFLG